MSAENRQRVHELIEQSFEAESEEEARGLIKKALKIEPENVDALIIEANLQPDPELRTKELAMAVEIGRKKVEAFDLPPGMLSLDPEARPYLRALYSYAGAMLLAGRAAECLATYEKLLALDERDAMGARYELVSYYLTADRLEDAQRIERRYAEDESAFLSWARTLLYYRLREFKTARKHLELAREGNPFVEDGLGEADAEPAPPDGLHAPGDESEADWILFHQGIAWLLNPLAVGWLSGELDPDHPDYVGPLDEIAVSLGGPTAE